MEAVVRPPREAIAFAYENPRADIQALVPSTARRILDVGCSSGALGAALKARQGAEVIGIELESDYATEAAERLDRVVCADVEKMFAGPVADHALGRFDCLIAGDVLEHLRDPWTVLRHASGLLEPGGTAVVSLPNVRFWQTFWELGIKGRWPRRGIGIYDRTHLRFFTASDGMELLRQAGLDLVQIDRVYAVSSEFNSRYDRWGRWAAKTPARPFFVFQHLFLGRRASV